ncbi:MAG TPA: winged helix-turn-helix domain-containing protein, partial [Candidatus Acidoferrum sp.]|nr:winged helix-turn-helix domain-containing protein [Candidatus Acidoferrum sp.]
MPDATQAPAVRRFGAFEIDLQAGELRKRGMRLRLSGQPFQVLAVLVEHAGNVVTREELHSKLWLSDTFVDFDHGLNNAIARIRDVLDDSSETPRYVETIPRRGYRFIAPVADVRQVTVSASSAESTVSLAPKIARPDAPPPSVVTVAKRFPSRRLQMLLGGVAVLGVAALLFVLYRGRSAKGWRGPAIRSLAVLPLNNLSGDPEQEYFADGMTEALIAELGKISAPRVVSRQSIMQYKGSKKGLSEIARELNVDAVLEGTVERSGDRVRVIVRLDQVSPEGQLWSNQYNRDIRDLLRLQDEIARAVTDEIQVKLTQQERARLASSRPVNPEAQDYYFRALHSRNTWEAGYFPHGEPDLQTAISYFRQAIEKDSNYGPAYAGMADAYINLGNPQTGNHAPKETLPLANAAATRAVEVAPLLGEAHFALAQTLELYDWNWSEAERQYKLALELSPNYALAHVEYGRFLQALGQNDEAMKQMAYAAELNPMDLQTRMMVGVVTYAARQYDSAISQLKELNTSYPGIGDFGLGWCYREKKMYPEAIAALERCVVRSGRAPLLLANLASVYGFAGRKREAVKLIDELKERSRQHHISA